MTHKLCSSLLLTMLLVCQPSVASGETSSHSGFVSGQHLGIIHKTSFPDKSQASNWKIGSGEPPIGPGKAFELATQALKKEFPSFGPSEVDRHGIKLLSTPGSGFYYSIGFTQAVTASPPLETSELTFFVLLNGTVVAPQADPETTAKLAAAGAAAAKASATAEKASDAKGTLQLARSPWGDGLPKDGFGIAITNPTEDRTIIAAIRISFIDGTSQTELVTIKPHSIAQFNPFSHKKAVKNAEILIAKFQ